ncbi:hypothetical protein DFH09DRAFT_1121116 [Mycena vulgaris]|nr:hypothetical protein DFH09DRAFT_1121116 [Mycena vulgaris]
MSLICFIWITHSPIVPVITATPRTAIHRFHRTDPPTCAVCAEFPGPGPPQAAVTLLSMAQLPNISVAIPKVVTLSGQPQVPFTKPAVLPALAQQFCRTLATPTTQPGFWNGKKTGNREHRSRARTRERDALICRESGAAEIVGGTARWEREGHGHGWRSTLV